MGNVESENNPIAESLKMDSKRWDTLIEKILSDFAPGELISHQWLRNKLGIKEFKGEQFEDYASIEALVEAVKRSDLEYMALVETLRSRLLENYKGYLKNVSGEGYTILPADYLMTEAYKQFIKALDNNIRKKEGLCIKYVQPVTAEQQAKDNDTRARYSWFKQRITKDKK